MAIDLDDEILQDFLVEAGEILELLSEQLVELEQKPEDSELLNSIFRGFHTVKGGAGFLALDPLVDICHVSEDIFDILRTGQRVADSGLMDTILQVLDVLNVMFGRIHSGEDPEAASPTLFAALERFKNDGDGNKAEQQTESELISDANTVKEVDHSQGNVSDEVEKEFEAMLQGALSPSITEDEDVKTVVKNEPPSDEITEEEFEQLLDELHGKDSGPTAKVSTPKVVESSEASADITEDEFDQLLDQLHGRGKGPTEQSTPVKKEVETKPAVLANEIKKPAKPSKKVDSASSTKAAPKVETTVRVDTQRLDDIMNMVGELVLVRNRLSKLRSGNNEDEEMSKAISNLDIVTADLQRAVMKTRMQPIKKVFGRFPRVVRDLSRNLNKKISLELVGEETDLDKNLVDALADPLVHLVRNAVDHGIEMPEDRIKAQKPEEGLVVLSAFQEGDHILLTIEDDGKGMDADALRASAVNKGLMDEEAASRLTDEECYNLIFAAGFSTKTEISDVSGRGVGMDVVKTRITGMNGTVHVESELGRGSKIIIKLPLTLAIMSTLMVKLSEQDFALPLSSVVEILSLDLSKTNMVNGQLVVMVRGKAMPLYYLNEWLIPGFQHDDKSNTEQHVVVVNTGHHHIGFVVDQLLGQEEVVIKPLGAMLTNVEGLAGATITGDGSIALILDIPTMLSRYA